MLDCCFYPPEGASPLRNYTLQDLISARESGDILEGVPNLCTADKTLVVPLGELTGILPREEAVAPWISGAGRDISVISKVGKQICFTVKSVQIGADGKMTALLSRREAQERAMLRMQEVLTPGSILKCRVLRAESFGVFLDVGCGVVALLPAEYVSVSRSAHPKERFRPGQWILAAVRSICPDTRRITMTHRELLGTWAENAARFSPGETVPATVRSVKPYGIFLELTPNLSGLAESQEGWQAGDRAAVYLKSISPETMKLKLQIVDRLPQAETPAPFSYFITDRLPDVWRYAPEGCARHGIETDFSALTASCP